jgi:hypothetical protein
MCPGPGARITGHTTRTAFNFYEVNLVQRYYEEIDLIDAAVFRNEFKIAPGAKRVLLWQALAHIAQRRLFPGVGRFRNLDPAMRHHHASSVPYSLQERTRMKVTKACAW